VSATTAAAIDTRPVDGRTAAAIESAEARAWSDLVAAAPAEFAVRVGLRAEPAGRAVAIGCVGGGFDRGLFNRPIGLGVIEPADREVVRALVDRYRKSGARRFMLVSQPHCLPASYDGWLRGEGLVPGGAWDRVVRDDAPASSPPDDGGRQITVDPVGHDRVELWTSFLADVYGVEAEPWLGGAHGRPGWHHYLAFEHGRAVGARSMYLPGPGELAFLAIDGPVPGVMTADHAPDARICARIIGDGLALGARGFVADIEAPSAAMDTPAYRIFAALGFRRPYTRTHMMPG
jgi:hypothetical protein